MSFQSGHAKQVLLAWTLAIAAPHAWTDQTMDEYGSHSDVCARFVTAGLWIHGLLQPSGLARLNVHPCLHAILQSGGDNVHRVQKTRR